MLTRIKQYQFDWKLSLFTLLLFPILLRLGFWQLEREQEKLDLQNLYESRQSAELVDLSALDISGDLQYVSVSLHGRFDNEHSFLLDNKIFEGQVGFEVLTPFAADNGVTVIVNRGWIAQNEYREILPPIEEVSGELELQGRVYVPLGEQFMLGNEDQTGNWPRVIQSLNIEDMAAALNTTTDVFPYSVRLAPLQPGVFVRNWPVISTSPEKHRGYAIQWFTMATVLLFLYLFISTKTESSENTADEMIDRKGKV
jgi:cytochrome oxidase assembly protein ShyY1